LERKGVAPADRELGDLPAVIVHETEQIYYRRAVSLDADNQLLGRFPSAPP
jgi:hypothetical protein